MSADSSIGNHSNGDGTFDDVSHLLRDHRLVAPGFAASFVDYDNDNDLDIYVVNDKVNHPIGNILWRNDHAHFVDFDDARNGPAIQDLWMLLSGDYSQRSLQLADIMEGYSEFCDFNRAELRLIEPLRAMRLLHYAAWLARRWDDPAFPHNFPWFNTERYWAEHVLSLREQLAALQEPVLQWL